jgi:threonine 3-dehydrogenase
VPLDIARLLINREIGLRGIYGRLIDETWLAMEALLVSGGINVDPVLTHSFELERFDEAFSTAASGQAGKVVLQLA